MTTNRVISDDINVWPKDIQLMVEQGYFTPMEETPLKNHDWREDIVDKYNQLKATLNYGKPAGMQKLLTEMPPPEERPHGPMGIGAGASGPAAVNRDVNLSEEDKLGIMRYILKVNYGQARMTGGRWTEVRHAEGDVICAHLGRGRQDPGLPPHRPRVPNSSSGLPSRS